jgi:hypothetical protein
MDRNYTGPCVSCCSCPAPSLAVVSRSYSKIKCGVTDPSQPTKKFLTVAQTADYAEAQFCTGADPAFNNYTITVTYDRDTCTSSCTAVVVVSGSPNVYTNEYTTAELMSDAVSLLPSWGALPSFGSASAAELAYADLTTDETEYSIMESKYQFAHPIPPSSTYSFSWIERFVPSAGGSPTDTAQSYTWDGTILGGYNPSDKSTWPKTSIFETDYPSSNGVTTLRNLTCNCGGGPITLFGMSVPKRRVVLPFD